MFTQRGETRYGKQKNRGPPLSKETLTIPPAMIMGGKATMQETGDASQKQISKRMQKHSGIWTRENMRISLLVEEENKNIGEC